MSETHQDQREVPDVQDENLLVAASNIQDQEMVPIERLQDVGINVSDIAKLKQVGITTIKVRFPDQRVFRCRPRACC